MSITPTGWSRIYYVWDDPACTNLGAISTGTGSEIEVEGKSMGLKNGGLKINWVFETRVVTPVRPNFVTTYNAVCPGWTLNTPRDVLDGVNCPELSIYDDCERLYDLVRVNGDELHLGRERNDKNYCEPENRPKRLSPHQFNRVGASSSTMSSSSSMSSTSTSRAAQSLQGSASSRRAAQSIRSSSDSSSRAARPIRPSKRI